jgi:hypothetical protein
MGNYSVSEISETLHSSDCDGNPMDQEQLAAKIALAIEKDDISILPKVCKNFNVNDKVNQKNI